MTGTSYRFVCVITSKTNLFGALVLQHHDFYFIGNYMSHHTFFTDLREFPMEVQFPFDATDLPIFELIVLENYFFMCRNDRNRIAEFLDLDIGKSKNENF